jgi:hypothetical protein
VRRDGRARALSTLLLAYTIVPHAPGPLQLNGPLWTLAYEWWLYLLAMFGSAALIERQVLAGLLPFAAIVALFVASHAGALLWAFLAVWGAGFALGCAYLEGLLDRPVAPRALAAVAAVAVGLVLAIGRGDVVALVVEPLQRLGNRAHWTMCLVSIVGACALAMAIRRRPGGIPAAAWPNTRTRCTWCTTRSY